MAHKDKKGKNKGRKKGKTAVKSLTSPTVNPHKDIIAGIPDQNREWIPFGDDNLFPQAVSALNRATAVNRGILRSKKTYIVGKRFVTGENNTELQNFVDEANADGESLREVFKPLLSDNLDGGNAWMELVKDKEGTYLNLYHHDWNECRLHNDKEHVLIHPNWRKVDGIGNKKAIKKIALYPNFSEDEEEEGVLRSVLHIKSYEPEFKHYGVPEYIAGMEVSAIAYKTDKWNLSRLDNGYKGSGVLAVGGEFESEDEAEELVEKITDEFTGEGNTGKIIVIAKNNGGEDTEFTPMNEKHDADWTKLHTQTASDLIVSHAWFRALTSLPDNTGFDTQRILNEYQVALSTTISEKQEQFLQIFRKVIKEELGIDAEELNIENQPPVKDFPPFMMIWEARKIMGYPYDENDERQQAFVGTIISTKKKDND